MTPDERKLDRLADLMANNDPNSFREISRIVDGEEWQEPRLAITRAQPGRLRRLWE